MNAKLKANTTDALKTGITKFSPQMRIAGKYVIDNQSAFGLDSIRETARKAHVSTYTLVKMAKTLGFQSFESFRQPFRQALVSTQTTSSDTEWLNHIQGPEGDSGVFVDAAKNSLSVVAKSLERQRLEELELATELLFSAKTVYVTAVRSSYAIAHSLHFVGKLALPSLQLIPHQGNSAIDDLRDAKEGDVLIAITVTPYSLETIEACKFAERRGLKLLLITDSEVVSPELSPNHTLVASVASTYNFGCFSGMMALVELLLAHLMDKAGEPAQDRINAYENLRLGNSAYWRAQKKH